jgi:sugar phosphate isomerase/epimerase
MGNWNYFFLRDPSELGIIDGVGLALDVGHAHLNHCLPGFLEASISHVHIHDNDGKEDMHLPVGRGTIDFLPVVRAIRRDNAVPVIEVSTLEGTDESIKALDRLQA